MPKVRMSPAWLAGLDAGENAEWIDSEQRGLVLRVRRRRMVWFVRYLYEGSARRYRIGAASEIGLSAARKLASSIRGRADGGQDPQQEKRGKREAARRRRMGETVHSALASWLKDKHNGPLAHWKGGLEGGSARAVMHHTKRLDKTLGKKLLSEITTKDLERFIGEAVAPATKNRCLGALRIFLGWAVRVGLIEKLPTVGIQRVHETPRTRVLSDDEIRILIREFDETRYGRALRLLFLTGLRRDEVLGMKWSWLDLDKGVLTIPPENDKVGRIRDEPRRAGLCPMAVTLLTEQRAALFAEGVSSEFVFATSTGGRPWDSLKPILYDLRGRRPSGKPGSQHRLAKKRVAVLPDDVTIHDIRRTVADSLFNRIGAQPWVVDHVVLGHARPKLLRTYMPTLPLKEAREMLQKWGEEIEKILSGAVGAQGQAL